MIAAYMKPARRLSLVNSGGVNSLHVSCVTSYQDLRGANGEDPVDSGGESHSFHWKGG